MSEDTKRACIWCGKPLPKRRRRYCSHECDIQYFQNVYAPLWWNNAKSMALERANHQCEQCGNRGYLEVHHKEKLENGESRHNSQKNRQENLIVLCRPCHEKVHHPHSEMVQKQEMNRLQGVLL